MCIFDILQSIITYNNDYDDFVKLYLKYLI